MIVNGKVDVFLIILNNSDVVIGEIIVILVIDDVNDKL